MSARPLRVVQWATGALGRSVIRGVLERPDLELAGVRVYDEAKAGVDAGTLAGRGPAGVAATADPGEILELDADCVVYAPAPGDPFADLETVCALLASGKNVVATNGYVYPHAHGPRLVAELTDACKRGGTSLHGTGVNPGFMSDLMPLMLSRLSRQITHVYARECSDFAGHPSWRMVHDMVGFGRDEDAYLRALRPARAIMRSLFGDSLHLVAAGLGLELDEVDLDVDHRLTGQDLTVAAGTIPAGTVAAARWTFSGMAGGRPVITLEVVHKADAARSHEWGPPGYAVRVEGRPSITLTTGGDWVTSGIAAAAAHALNAVPVVCAAEPGIRTFLDLPPITGRCLGG
ncbi:NAD(P)H-dependent amine dehydrogenase family protein [Actinomadura macrotermitis]|uniref:2,4-diaminopentanoate dehydrogenase n=1 Tax=Actinomadura macrotermitis TaxID=2585200 RepID=A0A7K0BRN8_9ACTN|nr:dihydrodipicolinate reductase [Actinomadura macrotermitis]MQY03374.1 2,4-diaminopentanoate dehydrogenase [Actinomadura macrotermitis]